MNTAEVWRRAQLLRTRVVAAWIKRRKTAYLVLEVVMSVTVVALAAWYTFEAGWVGFLFSVFAGALGWMTVSWFGHVVFPRLIPPPDDKR